MDRPRLAIIGGSGLCTLPELDIVSKVKPETRYGYPSDEIVIGRHAGQTVAFLPRHGSKHQIPPHRVPYKANIAALKSLGIEHIVSTCIAGSLKEEIRPGTFVLLDQFVDRTWGRDDYFDTDGDVVHLPMATPFCRRLREKLLSRMQQLKVSSCAQGTVVVIQGPRFSTIAESQWFISNGWDVVNMTQYPECYFAREMEICYASVAMITDYDVGVTHNLQMLPQRMPEVLEVFHRNIAEGKRLIFEIISDGSFCDENCCRGVHLDEYYKSPAPTST